MGVTHHPALLPFSTASATFPLPKTSPGFSSSLSPQPQPISLGLLQLLETSKTPPGSPALLLVAAAPVPSYQGRAVVLLHHRLVLFLLMTPPGAHSTQGARSGSPQTLLQHCFTWWVPCSALTPCKPRCCWPHIPRDRELCLPCTMCSHLQPPKDPLCLVVPWEGSQGPPRGQDTTGTALIHSSH